MVNSARNLLSHLRTRTLDFCDFVGAETLFFLEHCGDFARFLFNGFREAVTPPWQPRLILEQMYLIGVRSLPIAILTAVFVGMVMVLQTGVQLIKFGAKNYVPGVAFIANAREMVPVFTAVVVGARVAASITAELGTMRVTEQIDALEVLNVNPVRYLVVPRLIAMTFMLPLISTLCLVAGYFGGQIVGNASLNINPLEYYSVTLKFAYLEDVYGGLTKTIFFGTIIAGTGCYYGFRTYGGAEGVGRATTNAVVVSLILILISDYLLTSLILTLLGWIA